MGFKIRPNWPEIENTLRAKEEASRPVEAASVESYRPVREWQAVFAAFTPSLTPIRRQAPRLATACASN